MNWDVGAAIAEIGRGILDPEFGKLIDELLKDAEPNDTYKRMAAWADNHTEDN